MKGFGGAAVWRAKQARRKRGMTTERPRGCRPHGNSSEMRRRQPQAVHLCSRAQGHCAGCGSTSSSWARPCSGTCPSCPPKQRPGTRVPASSARPAGGADALYLMPAGFSWGDSEKPGAGVVSPWARSDTLIGEDSGPGTRAVARLHFRCHGNLAPP